MRHTLFGAAAAAFVAFGRPAAAAPPATISFQGALTGIADGARTATFALYDAASGGNAVWTETKTITVASGRFVTALGDNTAFPASVTFDKAYWVGVRVGADPEMTPRLPLASVPYALALPNVFVNRSSGRVGIGTSAPASTLHVVGSVRAADPNGQAAVVASADGGNGSVSVLNSSGNTRVQMRAVSLGSGVTGGRVDVDDSVGSARVGLFTDADSVGWLYGDALRFPNATGGKAYFYTSGADAHYGIGVQSGLLQLYSSTSGTSVAIGYGSSEDFHERMRVTGSGRVGIGTSSPTTTLDVRGNIKMNSAGDMYAAGGQENLYIVRGLVNANGTPVAGSGFTVSRTGEGRYTVTFQKAEFDQPPAVAITPWTAQPVLAVTPVISGTVGQPAKFSVITYLNGTATDCAFSFIATAYH